MAGQTLPRWAWLACALVGTSCGFSGPALTPNGDADADGPPVTVSFASSASTEDEASGAFQIDVTLSAPATSTITVPYQVTAGTATAGDDFSASDGTLTFAPGETTQSIDVAIVPDAAEEPDEQFSLTLLAPTGNATLGATTTHQVTISSSILARIGFTTATTTDNEASDVTLTLQLTAPAGPGASVNYTVTGDASPSSAAHPDHNLLATGKVDIPEGVTSVNLPVLITDDNTDEVDEHVVVTLDTSVGVVIDSNAASHDHTITNNDTPSQITFMSTSASQAEAATTVNLTVQLNKRSEKQITVMFAPNGAVTNAASSPADYSYGTGTTLTWLAGDETLTKTIAVQIAQDTLDEFDEIVETGLSGATNATIGSNDTHTLTITDDAADVPPTVGFSGMTNLGEINETDTDFTRTFTVSLSAASGKPISVDFTGSNNDASYGGDDGTGGDYNTLNQEPVEFAPGETSRQIVVTIVGDNTDESGNPSKEVATLTLTGATNATLNANTTATFTIVDDD